MARRINRCVELLEQDQAIYYDGPHSGHLLTHAQGRTGRRFGAPWALACQRLFEESFAD